jgi:hypothetical protein
MRGTSPTRQDTKSFNSHRPQKGAMHRKVIDIRVLQNVLSILTAPEWDGASGSRPTTR